MRLMPDMTNPRWWMNPRPFGTPHYDTQEEADLAQARRQVKFYAAQARKTLRAIRLTRDIVLVGGYDDLTPEAVESMFDNLDADLRFYLRKRRKWFVHQHELEAEQAAHPMAAE